MSARIVPSGIGPLSGGRDRDRYRSAVEQILGRCARLDVGGRVR